MCRDSPVVNADHRRTRNESVSSAPSPAVSANTLQACNFPGRLKSGMRFDFPVILACARVPGRRGDDSRFVLSALFFVAESVALGLTVSPRRRTCVAMDGSGAVNNGSFIGPIITSHPLPVIGGFTSSRKRAEIRSFCRHVVGCALSRAASRSAPFRCGSLTGV